mmetsp:Transcript_8471/g.18556  ORF Transcript_8471/g.18556 Transcript_8471/m.18556 type:complete len:280 (+) Transcript_8471:2650-3489(+)
MSLLLKLKSSLVSVNKYAAAPLVSKYAVRPTTRTSWLSMKIDWSAPPSLIKDPTHWNILQDESSPASSPGHAESVPVGTSSLAKAAYHFTLPESSVHLKSTCPAALHHAWDCTELWVTGRRGSNTYKPCNPTDTSPRSKAGHSYRSTTLRITSTTPVPFRISSSNAMVTTPRRSIVRSPSVTPAGVAMDRTASTRSRGAGPSPGPVTRASAAATPVLPVPANRAPVSTTSLYWAPGVRGAAARRVTVAPATARVAGTTWVEAQPAEHARSLTMPQLLAS